MTNERMAALAREFAELSREKKRIGEDEKRVKARLAELDPQLQEAMTQEGVPRLPIEIAEVDVDDAVGKTIEEALTTAQSLDNVDFDFIVTLLRRRGLLAENKPAKTVTVYIGSRVWATPVIDDPERDKANDAEYARACDALEAEGFGEYAQRRFNVISLSSAVKEMVENGQITLEGNEATAFGGTVKVVEKFQINARGA